MMASEVEVDLPLQENYKPCLRTDRTYGTVIYMIHRTPGRTIVGFFASSLQPYFSDCILHLALS